VVGIVVEEAMEEESILRMVVGIEVVVVVVQVLLGDQVVEVVWQQ